MEHHARVLYVLTYFILRFLVLYNHHNISIRTLNRKSIFLGQNFRITVTVPNSNRNFHQLQLLVFNTTNTKLQAYCKDSFRVSKSKEAEKSWWPCKSRCTVPIRWIRAILWYYQKSSLCTVAKAVLELNKRDHSYNHSFIHGSCPCKVASQGWPTMYGIYILPLLLSPWTGKLLILRHA